MAVSRIVDVQVVVGIAVHEVVIDVLQIRVLLRDTQLAALVRLEDGIETLSLSGIACGGLSAATDAAVGAGHDFDEVKVLFAGLDLLDQLVGIAQTVGHADAQLQIACGDLKGLDAVQTTDTALGNSLQGVGRSIVQDTADNGLGHAAGDAEDDACAGVITQRIVGLGLGQPGKVDTGFLDHAAQFLSGQDQIDQTLAVLLQFGTLCLKLLGSAGHDGHGVNIFALELATDDGAQHFHGT